MEDYSKLSNLFEEKVGTLSEDIYNIMANFGFNDEEIKIIFNTDKNIEEMLLIDLFHETHDRLALDNSEKARALKSKLLIILRYYLQEKKNNSKFSKTMEKTIEEFNDELAKSHRTSK